MTHVRRELSADHLHVHLPVHFAFAVAFRFAGFPA
jgi:hypothetical protein